MTGLELRHLWYDGGIFFTHSIDGGLLHKNMSNVGCHAFVSGHMLPSKLHTSKILLLLEKCCLPA